LYVTYPNFMQNLRKLLKEKRKQKDSPTGFPKKIEKLELGTGTEDGFKECQLNC
jgi:hypothetical protein